MNIQRVYFIFNIVLQSDKEQLGGKLKSLRRSKFNINIKFYNLLKTCYEVRYDMIEKSTLDADKKSVYQIAQLWAYLKSMKNEQFNTEDEYKRLYKKYNLIKYEPKKEVKKEKIKKNEDLNDKEVVGEIKNSQQLIIE
jgi:hypothetical protein